MENDSLYVLSNRSTVNTSTKIAQADSFLSCSSIQVMLILRVTVQYFWTKPRWEVDKEDLQSWVSFPDQTQEAASPGSHLTNVKESFWFLFASNKILISLFLPCIEFFFIAILEYSPLYFSMTGHYQQSLPLPPRALTLDWALDQSLGHFQPDPKAHNLSGRQQRYHSY